jgi:histidine phosphotransferase ChpT
MTDRPDAPASHPALPLRVAELLCSRLCHDLIGPTAAVSNGLELLDDGRGAIDPEVFSLLAFSVRQAAGKLMFFRVAYGLGGDNADALTLADAAGLIRGMVEEDKVTLDLAEGPAALGRGPTRLLLNAALVGLETLPNRGRLTLSVDASDGVRIEIAGEGPGVRLRPEVRAVLDPAADVAGLTPRNVQGHFTAWFARSLGGGFALTGEAEGRVAFAATLP